MGLLIFLLVLAALKNHVCERNTTEGVYLEEYETKLDWLSSTLRSYEEVDEGYHKMDVKEYFVITKREVWNCRGKENTPTSSLNFLRIVTELLGKHNVKLLSFYDGFEVVFVPDSSMPQAENKGELIPIVREIKYINSERHYSLKYEGFLKFQWPKEGNSYFKEIQSNPLLKHGDEFKEVHDRFNWKSGSVFLKETGTSDTQTPSVRLEKYLQESSYEFIELVLSPKKTIGTSDEVAICKRSENDPNLYAETYHTKWSNTVLRDSINVDIRDLLFPSNFVITKHELWTCQTKRTKEKFVRSIMEYIGAQPFELVFYSNDINLWKFVFNVVKQTQSIAVRDIAYFENSNRVSYDGWIVEEEHLVDKAHTSKLLTSSHREKCEPERAIVNIM